MQLSHSSRQSLRKLFILLRTQGRHIFGFLACLWVFHYLSGVRRVIVHFGRGKNPGSSRNAREAYLRLKKIIGACPSLAATYWPTWYAHSAMLQFSLLGFKEFRARFLQPTPYTREVLTLKDGGRIALDWVPPKQTDKVHPVCVLLHGMAQDSSSATMVDIACSLARRGMPTVVMNRRSYGGLDFGDDDTKISIFGFDEDLDEVLCAVNRRHPGVPVAIIGFSCGATYAMRYVGARSQASVWHSLSLQGGLPPILCMVAYDSGYDVSSDGAHLRIQFPYNYMMLAAVKFNYGFRPGAARLQEKANTQALISPVGGFKDTFRAVRQLAGIEESSAWLDKQQPCIEEIRVPSLLVNSRDDPINTWSNVELYLEDVAANPNLALVELQRGAHGCKYGFWGYSSVIDSMVAEFVLSSWESFQMAKPGMKTNAR